MLRTLGQVGRLTRAEWWVLARAQCALLKAQLEVWFRPRGQLLTPSASAGEAALSSDQRLRAELLSWAVTRAARYGIFRPACLARSVALRRLLSQSGVPGSQLHIGVRSDATGLAAHAWVTLSGVVIGDDPSFVSRYTSVAGTGRVNAA